MLLFERTKILGAAILVPVLMNIIVVDYFFEISIGAMLSAISHLTAICYVLWYNRQPVIEAMNLVIVRNEGPKIQFKQKAIRFGAAIVIVAIIIMPENQALNFVDR